LPALLQRLRAAPPTSLTRALARGPALVAQLLLFAALAAGALGCGGGATYSSGVFHDGPVSFRVTGLGAPWERVGIGEQNDLAWMHEELAAIAQVNATCDQPDQDVPLQTLTRHLLNGFTAYTYPPVEPDDLQTVPMDGREAQRTHLVAKLDGVPRELLLVVMKKDDCVYDFALVAPPGERFTRALPDFNQLIASFRAEARSSAQASR